MSDKPEQADCQQRIASYAAHNAFLSRHDQHPELDAGISRLSNSLQQLETDTAAKLKRAMEDVAAEFVKYTHSIDEIKGMLDSVFTELEQSPLNPSINRKTATALVYQVNQLSRRLRPRMFRTLEKLAPKTKLVEKTLSELAYSHQQLINKQPEELWLLRAEKTQHSLSGESIYQLEFVPRLEELCKTNWLARIRYAVLRWKCRLKYRFFRLPLKAIALDFLFTRNKLHADEIIGRHIATHEELSTRLLDAWRGIQYNLETAAAEIEDTHDRLRNGNPEDVHSRPEELRAMVFNALHNCVEVFDDINVVYASVLLAVSLAIQDEHQRSLKVIKQGVIDADNFRVRIKWLFLTKFEKLRVKINSFIKSASTQIAEKFKYLWAKLPDNFLTKNIILQKQTDEETLLQLSELPTEQELLEKSRALPPIYRRLFRNEALTNREFQVAMESEMELLATIYQRWESGKISSVAVVGPEGSGKTSLINCFENEIETDVKVARIELVHRVSSSDDVLRMVEDIFKIDEPCRSAAELIKIISQQERQVVIVERAHLLFLRTIGSREAIETFAYILLNTRHKFLWIVSFRLHPWKRMGYLYQMERYFTHVVNTQFHNADELMQALLLRQRATGQVPLFSAEGISSYRLKKVLLNYREYDPEAQKVLADIYFETLFSITGGNMETALYYWLKSLSIDTENRVIIAPCFKTDTGFIKKLDSRYLISLAEVLAHGGLSPKEYEEIFNMAPMRSKLMLDYLRQIRLLQGDNLDKHGQPLLYSINPLFYQPIYSLLSTRHILY